MHLSSYLIVDGRVRGLDHFYNFQFKYVFSSFLQSMGLSCVPYLPKVCLNPLSNAPVLRPLSLLYLWVHFSFLLLFKFKIFVGRYLLLKALSALIQVLPELVCTIRNCEDGLREFSFWQLASLVSIVRQVWTISFSFNLLDIHICSSISITLQEIWGCFWSFEAEAESRAETRRSCLWWADLMMFYFLLYFVTDKKMTPSWMYCDLPAAYPQISWWDPQTCMWLLVSTNAPSFTKSGAHKLSVECKHRQHFTGQYQCS